MDLAHWTIGGQFEIHTRGSEYLPVGLLVDSKRHLSQTLAAQFFQESAHAEIYKTFARGISDNIPDSVSSSSRAASSAISSEPLTPKRPTCLLKSSISVQQAYIVITNLTGLTITCPSSRVLPALQDAEVASLTSLASLFGVVTGVDADVYELALAAAINEVFAAMRVSPPPSPTVASPAGFDLKAMGRSLRDDVAADEVLRSVVALLASARSLLRLTVKALVRRGLMADVPIPLDTLPPRALTQLYSHLLLQESVFAIVQKSTEEGMDTSRAAASSIIGRRIAELDVFMSEQITGGMTCHFSPLEAMYGIVSRGSLGAFVATFRYVPGEAPAVAALMQAARRLNFGMYGRTQSVDYRTSYAPVCRCSQRG